MNGNVYSIIVYYSIKRITNYSSYCCEHQNAGEKRRKQSYSREIKHEIIKITNMKTGTERAVKQLLPPFTSVAEKCSYFSENVRTSDNPSG